MNDQIKAVENLIAANAKTQPRTPQLEAAKGYLSSALTNMQDHVSEVSRQIEARRSELELQQKKTAELQAAVAGDAEPAS